MTQRAGEDTGRADKSGGSYCKPSAAHKRSGGPSSPQKVEVVPIIVSPGLATKLAGSERGTEYPRVFVLDSGEGSTPCASPLTCSVMAGPDKAGTRAGSSVRSTELVASGSRRVAYLHRLIHLYCFSTHSVEKGVEQKRERGRLGHSSPPLSSPLCLFDLLPPPACALPLCYGPGSVPEELMGEYP